MQTERDPIEDQIQNLKDKELDLYRKKYDLQEENKKLQGDNKILRTKIIDLEKINHSGIIENEFLKGQVKKYSNYEIENRKSKDILARANYKIKQYQDLVSNRDGTISKLLHKERKVKEEMGRIIRQFNDVIKDSKALQEEIHIKESLVYKLQNDLK